MSRPERPRVRSRELLLREVDHELLVHDTVSGRTCCLDPTASSLFRRCDGALTVPELFDAVRRELASDVPDAALWVGLEELRRFDLLATGSLQPTPFDGLSRRAMLRRIGTAAALAPLVLSVVPTPASAQSLTCDCGAPSGLDARPEGCPCANNNDCCGNCLGGTMTCSGPLVNTLPPGAVCCPPNIPI